jgi:hypothetical protein
MRVEAPPREHAQPELRPRRRGRRRFLVVLAAVAAVLALGLYAYGPQLVSLLTHRKGAPTVAVPVRPFPKADRPLVRLAAVGDVGEGEEEEWQTAWAIHSLSWKDDPYDGLLLLGDNVYPSGDPARLTDTVFRPFAIVLEQGVKLYAIVGNHDAGHADEQAAAFGMPGTWWSYGVGPVRLIGLDSNRVGDPSQLAFLEDTLRTAKEPWKIVAIHEPPYSAGYQGSNIAVRDTFGPLFAKYGVQLVLSGHEHDYERDLPIDGTVYVVSGAGGRTRGTGEDPYTAVSWSVLHFVDINVYTDRILLRAVNQDGDMFDAAEIGLDGSERDVFPSESPATG